MTKKYNNISNEAVKNATGKTWDEWFTLLDKQNAEEFAHKEIADMLINDGYIPKECGWWAQSVTVAYEYSKGKRVKGKTANAGFQMGVQKTLHVKANVLWKYLTSSEGLEVWLGNGTNNFKFKKGYKYRTDEGTIGEIRSVYPGEKLRLTWQPSDWTNKSTLQLFLLDKDDRTALRFHQEKLIDSNQRKLMKKYWRKKLHQINESLKELHG